MEKLGVFFAAIGVINNNSSVISLAHSMAYGTNALTPAM
jgi:hypothetical protein